MPDARETRQGLASGPKQRALPRGRNLSISETGARVARVEQRNASYMALDDAGCTPFSAGGKETSAKCKLLEQKSHRSGGRLTSCQVCQWGLQNHHRFGGGAYMAGTGFRDSRDSKGAQNFSTVIFAFSTKIKTSRVAGTNILSQ